MPVEGPRGEHGFYIVSDGTNRPLRIKMRARRRSSPARRCEDDHRRTDRRRHRRDWFDRRRDGRRGSMSFHPAMDYGAAEFIGPRATLPEEGPAFAFTAENRAKLEEFAARYPPEQRKSAILPRCISRSISRATSRRTRCATSPRDRLHAGGCRRRRLVLHDVLHAAGRQVRAAGVPHAVVRADGRRARDRRALRRRSASRPGETDATASSRCSKSSASARAIARRSSW